MQGHQLQRTHLHIVIFSHATPPPRPSSVSRSSLHRVMGEKQQIKKAVCAYHILAAPDHKASACSTNTLFFFFPLSLFWTPQTAAHFLLKVSIGSYWDRANGMFQSQPKKNNKINEQAYRSVTIKCLDDIVNCHVRKYLTHRFVIFHLNGTKWV